MSSLLLLGWTACAARERDFAEHARGVECLTSSSATTAALGHLLCEMTEGSMRPWTYLPIPSWPESSSGRADRCGTSFSDRRIRQTDRLIHACMYVCMHACIIHDPSSSNQTDRQQLMARWLSLSLCLLLSWWHKQTAQDRLEMTKVIKHKNTKKIDQHLSPRVGGFVGKGAIRFANDRHSMNLDPQK